MSTCLKCGSEVQPNSRFCSQCGAPYSAPEGPIAQPSGYRGPDNPPPLPDFGLPPESASPPPPPDFGQPPPDFGPPPAFTPRMPESAPKVSPLRSARPARRKPLVACTLISCLGLFIVLVIIGISLLSFSKAIFPWVRTQVERFSGGQSTSPSAGPTPQILPTAHPLSMPTTPGLSTIAPTQMQVLPAQESPVVAPENRRELLFEGITVTYDQSLASRIGGSIVPTDPGASFAASPEHTLLTLEGYPIYNKTFRPEIRIYPVAEYRRLNDTAAGIIDDLHILLTQQPSRWDGDFPFLPVMNAGQLIQAKAFIFDFQDGSGLRYLTQFGQDIYPINNQNLVYIYQGLTFDGAYYISAIFPIGNPVLPLDGSQIPGGSNSTFEQQFQSYIGETTQLLDASEHDRFVPDLNLLDNLMWSLEVKPEERLPSD
jgi:hypothetical protein